MWCPDFKTISSMVKAKSFVDVFLDYVASSSLIKNPVNLWESSLLVLLPLGHFVTKVDLLKYRMRSDQNIKK